MTNEKSIKKFFDGVEKDIKADQIAKGIIASGASAESLKDEVTPISGQMFGSSTYQQQVHGRKPGTMPPVEDILAWIKLKNIHSDIKPEQLAWAIAKKIAKSGTDIFQHKRPGLDFDGIVAKNKKDLVENLLKGTKDQIKILIRNAVKS